MIIPSACIWLITDIDSLIIYISHVPVVLKYRKIAGASKGFISDLFLILIKKIIIIWKVIINH